MILSRLIRLTWKDTGLKFMRTFLECVPCFVSQALGAARFVTDDESIQSKFKSMIIQLEDYVKMGQQPNPDILREIYDSVFNGESKKINLLKSTFLTVPKVNTKVFPRNYNQALYIDAINKHEMVFGIGPAGTGKTYLAVAHALKEILSHSKRKLVLTRPLVEAGEHLGFLPGDLEKKVNPFLRPLYDAMESIVSYQIIFVIPAIISACGTR